MTTIEVGYGDTPGFICQSSDGAFNPVKVFAPNPFNPASSVSHVDPSVANNAVMLPALPNGTATLAPGPSGGFDALAVHRTRLTVWQLGPGTATWRTTQTMNVPVQFGSSG